MPSWNSVGFKIVGETFQISFKRVSYRVDLGPSFRRCLGLRIRLHSTKKYSFTILR